MAKLKCSCGGVIRPEVLPEFDLTGFAGLPVRVTEVSALVCSSCGGQTLEAGLVERILWHIERDIMLSRRLLSGPEIRFLRKRCGWTQQEFADVLKVARGTVADWEREANLVTPHSDNAIRMVTMGKLRFGSRDEIVRQVAEAMPSEGLADLFLDAVGYLREDPATPPAFLVEKLKVTRTEQGRGKRG